MAITDFSATCKHCSDNLQGQDLFDAYHGIDNLCWICKDNLHEKVWEQDNLYYTRDRDDNHLINFRNDK